MGCKRLHQMMVAVATGAVVIAPPLATIRWPTAN